MTFHNTALEHVSVQLTRRPIYAYSWLFLGARDYRVPAASRLLRILYPSIYIFAICSGSRSDNVIRSLVLQ